MGLSDQESPRSVVGDAIFSEGSVIDIKVTEAEPVEGSWTVYEWEGSLTDNGVVLSPEDEEAGWIFSSKIRE